MSSLERVGALLVLFSLAVVPAIARAAAPPADPTAIAQGKILFTQHCAPCHAADRGDFGREMLPGTAALHVKYQGKVPALIEQRTDLTPELIRIYVRKGTWSMPPFRKTELSDADIDRISAYIAAAARSNTQ